MDNSNKNCKKRGYHDKNFRKNKIKSGYKNVKKGYFKNYPKSKNSDTKKLDKKKLNIKKNTEKN